MDLPPRHYAGDAEVPILMHNTGQATLISGQRHGTGVTPVPFATSHAAPAPPLVPQMNAGKPQAGRLTRAQQSELEMARRRAQKAAQGKAANTAAARKTKRRVNDDEDDNNTDDEMQQKLANVTDEKEAKRLKRLLRNRVSAQQARERKKSYLATLEEKCRAQELQLAEAEQRLKTLERENLMLRSVMKNMQGLKEKQQEVETIRQPENVEAAVPVICSFPRDIPF